MEVGQGGGLFFKSGIDNTELDKAIEDTLRRIQSLSQGAKKTGDVVDEAFKEMERTAREKGVGMEDVINSIRTEITSSFGKIDEAFNASKAGMAELQVEFDKVGKAMGDAFMKGDDELYHKLELRQRKIGAEIKVRQQLTNEIAKQGDELAKVEQEFEKHIQKVENASQTNHKLQTRLRTLRNEMAILIEQGISPQAPEYQKLQKELVSLTRIQRELGRETRVLASRQTGFQAVVSTVGGLSGAFSAATGTMSLFASENENLQRVMAKLQSVMAITMGLQQVSVMLNKDSAFNVVVLRKAKEWWTAVTVKAGVATKAESIALAENIVAQKAAAASTATTTATKVADTAATTLSTAATTAQATANVGLAGTFRLVGAAIKSIPVIGWVLAGISGLIGLFRHLTKDIRSAIREQEKFYKQIAEEVYQPLAAMQELRTEWEYLGDSLEEKQKFVDENAKKFLEYGIAVESVRDAEKLLSDPGNVQTFIDAQIAKAKSVALMATNAEDMKSWAEAYLKYQKALETPTVSEYKTDKYGSYWEEEKVNPEIAKYKKETEKYESAMRERSVMAQEFANQSRDLLKDINEDMGKTEKSLYEQYQKEIGDLTKQIQTSLDPDEIRKLQAKLKVIQEKNDELFNPREIREKKERETPLTEEEKQALREQELYERHYNRLLEDYGLYYEKRKKLAAFYAQDMEVLETELEKEDDPNKRKLIEDAISNRAIQYAKEVEAIEAEDNASYERIKANYRTFEEEKEAIRKEFAEKRKVAAEQGDENLLKQLYEAELKALQELNVESIITSETWNQLFGNLDNLAVDEMIRLRALIESQWEELDLSPEQLNALRDKINKVTEEISKRNPFRALLESIKRYKKGEKDVNFKDLARDAAASIRLIQGTWDAVTEGLANMGLAGDDITQKLMSDIGKMFESGAQLAEGIATGNPLSIIQGSIGLLSSAFDVFNFKDRRAERQIRRHAENLERLEEAYEQLGKAIDKALGSKRYEESQNAIKNLEKQQRELIAMRNAERGKKKTDKDKVKEYENAYKEAGESIAELVDRMRLDLLGMDAKTAAQQLGDAFIEAFKQGEDGLEAFGKKADEIVANIMQRMLIQKLLEQPLGQIFERYSKKWYDDKGDFIGFDTVISDAEDMGEEMKGVSQGFADAMSQLPESIRKYFMGEMDADTLKGAVKGVTEDTASLIAGQMNAMRIQQLEATSVLRDQLLKLVAIEHNTSYNYLLESIDNRLRDMSNDSSSIRAKGL